MRPDVGDTLVELRTHRGKDLRIAVADIRCSGSRSEIQVFAAVGRHQVDPLSRQEDRRNLAQAEGSCSPRFNLLENRRVVSRTVHVPSSTVPWPEYSTPSPEWVASAEIRRYACQINAAGPATTGNWKSTSIASIPSEIRIPPPATTTASASGAKLRRVIRRHSSTRYDAITDSSRAWMHAALKTSNPRLIR